MNIDGVYTALITPFDQQQGLDLEGYQANLEFQITNDVDGLLVLGTTGEAPTLTNEEKQQLISTTITVANSRLPVMAGISSNSTAITVENAKQAEDLGASMLLVATPYYNKPTQEGIFQHFSAIRAATSLPIVIYNIPGRCCINMETTTIQKIVNNLDNIIGIKESGGNLSQLSELIEFAETKDDFNVLTGDDAWTIPALAMGAKGLISVASNLVPREIKNLVNAMLRSDIKEAQKINNQLKELYRNCFIESNPIPIKYLMTKSKMAAGECRLPLTPVDEKNKALLDSTLAKLKK